MILNSLSNWLTNIYLSIILICVYNRCMYYSLFFSRYIKLFSGKANDSKRRLIGFKRNWAIFSSRVMNIRWMSCDCVIIHSEHKMVVMSYGKANVIKCWKLWSNKTKLSQFDIQTPLPPSPLSSLPPILWNICISLNNRIWFHIGCTIVSHTFKINSLCHYLARWMKSSSN